MHAAVRANTALLLTCLVVLQASSAAQEVEDLTSEASSSELSPALSEAAEDGFSQPLHEAVQQLLDPQSPVQAATSPNQHGRGTPSCPCLGVPVCSACMLDSATACCGLPSPDIACKVATVSRPGITAEPQTMLCADRAPRLRSQLQLQLSALCMALRVRGGVAAEPSAVLAATGNVDEQPVSAISWATAPEQARAEDVAKACQLMDHSMLVRLQTLCSPRLRASAAWSAPAVMCTHHV